ncbi:MAG: hypothetical protein FD167_2920 [bacterium]|nr:MAG: hypothetical protein FD167_2920 [bacterium]
MNETNDLFIGWDAAMQVLKHSNKLGIRGDLLYSIHFSVLQQLSARNIPVLPFDYENFIKAMKNFCFRDSELRKMYTSSCLVSVNGEGMLADVSTRIGISMERMLADVPTETAISMLEKRASFAEDIGLLLRSKEALAIIKESFKQDYMVTKVLVSALKELMNYVEDVYSKESSPLDCLFIIQVLKEWAKDKDFIQGVFNGVDYSWFPDEETEIASSKELLAR